MEKSVSQRIKLGIMVLLGMTLFTLGIYLIGNKQNMFGRVFEISCDFKDVSGLKLGNNVRYLGIEVGNVVGITMLNDTAIRVTMVLDVKAKGYMKKNAIATIGSRGLVGDMVVNIEPGIGISNSIGDADKIRAINKIGTDEMLNTLSRTNENAEEVTAVILQITNSINEGRGIMGMLVNDEKLATDVKYIMRNVRATTESSATLMKNLENVSGLLKSNDNILGVLLYDTVNANKVKALIGNLDASGEELKIMTKSLNRLILNLKDGDNSLVNTLANDSSLIINLKETLENINSGSQKFDENMEALKHHALFRGYFKKKDKK